MHGLQTCYLLRKSVTHAINKSIELSILSSQKVTILSFLLASLAFAFFKRLHSWFTDGTREDPRKAWHVFGLTTGYQVNL